MSTLKYNTRPDPQNTTPGLTILDRDRRTRRDEIDHSTKIRFKLFNSGKPPPPPVTGFWIFDNIIESSTVSLTAGFTGELSVNFGDGTTVAMVSGASISHTY